MRDAVSVEPVEPLELKGKRDPVPTYRLLSVDPEALAIARHLDAPLVGRVREKKRLHADFEDVVSERACHLFTLLGPAGVGKSRLVAEFLANVREDADVLRGRCLHYGDLVNLIGVDGLEGYLLARDGDLEGGEKLVRRAVERAAEIDFYDHKARAFELFAQTLGLAGKRSEAVQAARDALAIYEAKGDEAATESARALVASLSEGSAA